jgi:O-antigen/teichoic acid export membrane protein
MSSARRIASGSAAAWFQLGLAVVGQLCVVPIYLSAWDAQTYGAWLALQGLTAFVQLFDNGHARYLANEFLRLGNRRVRKIRRAFWSACLVGVVLGSVQTAIVGGLAFFGPRELLNLSPEASELVQQCAIVATLLAAVWWVFGSIGGLAVPVVAPFGHYPKTAWWGVAVALATTAAPAAVAWGGGNLLAAGLALAGAMVAVYIPLCLHLAKLILAAGLHPVRPCPPLAMRNLVRSQVLTVKNLFDLVRQQGMRLILAPLAGTTAVAGFSTMRTGANVALQGLSTITNPLMPELMRFVARRDQEKAKATLAAVWAVLAALLAPGAIVLQLVVAPLFALWTGGRIELDPVLFALFTTSVLVYALAQPAIAVVHGNNLLRVQLGVSVAAGSVVLGLTAALLPAAGLRGVGLALIFGEVVAAVSYVTHARRWLEVNGLHWPRATFRWAITSVVASSAAVMLVAAIPAHRPLVATIGLAATAAAAVGLMRDLPPAAQAAARNLIARRRATPAPQSSVGK